MLFQGKTTTSSGCKAADGSGCGGGEDPGSWNTGQDDSAVHGKHLPPSPRRQPNKSSLKVSRTAGTGPPAQDNDIPKLRSHQPKFDLHPLPPGRKPEDRYSCSPSVFFRATPTLPSPTFSHNFSSPANYSPMPAGRSRTISDPHAGTEPPQAQSQTASTGILRRKVLSKETVKQYQEKALQRQGSKGRQEGPGGPSTNSQSGMQVPWEKEVSKEGLLGFSLCLGQTKGSGQDQGLLEEIESMCCLGSVLNASLQLSQVHCNNSHPQVQGKATEES